ncbi:adenine phosphoribosyltransferase [Clostridium tetani]|uniref:Adenine phosphoribosyltransferase n=1 Tax=Clostridium tetani (strain Massachusetts / E88) TaxID=212717 RepID=APT_CLOTE|nr:adenine phosphoribosyltransferase [Clostridium tetani]Q892A7.1 RecName: Full=Adenine phosphoribosyltransferase; Short=APRT [Clostridium tetani E88]AAO36688.1 adenine phosphoribosyltransferase [Clostridium tetani E88]KGI39303.1 adenine phosphoribosyltransferase [Clostridium tetani ATCC 9441]KGI41076.1 adenine phosphoribosyltransferase [Clostridium tetani]KGI45238.1 adenine phosphoribosyltransferase [Clostridium tetani]KGI45823.1 adenine phosphoribosyltransferase [Clostridium tetani]
MDLKDKIRVIQGFPKEGISFKDVTTILQEKEAFKYTIDTLVEELKDKNVDVVVGPEARGFLFGAPLAYALGAGFVPVRKKGKLPSTTISSKYELEYGSDELEMHKDSIKPGQRVVIADDLLATGGTICSVIEMIESLGGEIVSINFLIELTDLKGREKLGKYDISSLVQYDI